MAQSPRITCLVWFATLLWHFKNLTKPINPGFTVQFNISKLDTQD